MSAKTNSRATVFLGGDKGIWKVDSLQTVVGEGLSQISRLTIATNSDLPKAYNWALTGVASNVRYVERPEKNELQAIQAPLGRPIAKCAALIPIQKSQAWWDLTQEERREIFESKSHHIAASMKYLPAVARQLYHSRDLGEPFDFLTWFEFAPEHKVEFEELVRNLRSTEEWRFVTREIDIRLSRE